ncbi:MAG: FAD-dependent oxidoreductase [Candidatus Nealsonbacteria bacterium]|nr:FAD-dependent oxidoreductase [Candidatus Nealsonbacteria bacterium]
MQEVDYLILGAGLAGLAAADGLRERAPADNVVVLERDEVPGGLVRADYFDGYWFDRVLHLLYFADPKTETRIRRLLGDELAPCPPTAWVETGDGVVRYPFQMHLRGLKQSTIVRCLADLAEVTYVPESDRPAHFQEMLLRTFGRGMCDTFMFPYNRKMWKRPLDGLAPSGFTWNITPPDLKKVLHGALTTDTGFQAYNATGWYPRPPKDAPVRGMQVLSKALAAQAADLRLEHSVESIDVERRVVVARCRDREQEFRFRDGCLCSIPLPRAIALCRQAPEQLRRACRRLSCNRVLSVMLSVRGPRPEGRGHWRYYADESIDFTRLIYMHEFDPDTAPPEGWGLMAELLETSRSPMRPEAEVIARVKADVARVGALPGDCQIIDAHVRTIDPAYVAFTLDSQPIIEEASGFLRDHGIEPLGRYGRWEYSSMGQVMRDAYTWADQQSAASPPRTRPTTVEE